MTVPFSDGNLLKNRLFMLKYCVILFFITSFFYYLSGNIKTQVIAQSSDLKEIYFQPSTEDFINPERGFFLGITISGYLDYNYIRQSGYSIAFGIIRLDNYRSSLIPQSVLNDLDSGFAKIRQAKIKVIPRVYYNVAIGDPDASAYWISQHLNQLKPIMEKNQDVIYLWQAGFVGAWGEWHSSTNINLNDPNAIRAILYNILDTLPASRMTAIRTPAKRMAIFTTSEITPTTAFNGSYLTRTGFHNDCFLANDTDAGTYSVSNMSVQSVKDYISRETRYVANGGETCEVTMRVSCVNAKADLEYMHWTYLNSEWYMPALDTLKSQGCYDEIHRRLGYRFVLSKVTVPYKVAQGRTMPLHIEVMNEGYAPMYNQRPVYLIFENMVNGIKTPLIVDAADPRRWLPSQDQTINYVDTNITVPANLQSGMYRLYIWLPDGSSSLQSIPEYSVRFANLNIWRPDTAYNYLTDNIEVTAITSPTPTLTPSSPVSGFTGQYFANMYLSGTPTLTRTDSTINFNWGVGSPDASIPNDNFSVRWSKTESFNAGTYRFSATADDGVRLKVDGSTIIDQWKDQSATTYTADLALTTGYHTIVMEYYENAWYAAAELSWSLISTPTPTPPLKPGDADGDGKVDEEDYGRWLLNYNPVSIQEGGSSIGDFNKDYKVDGIDYTIWLNNYGK